MIAVYDKVTHDLLHFPDAHEVALFLWGRNARGYEVLASLDNLPVEVKSLEEEIISRQMVLDALAGKPRLSARDKEILGCLTQGWADGDAKLFGHISYQAVFDLLKRLGAPGGSKEWQDAFMESLVSRSREGK